MNFEVSTPLNNDRYTEYAGVFSFLFRLSTLKLFGFCFWKCMRIMVKCQLLLSTTFAPLEYSFVVIFSGMVT